MNDDWIPYEGGKRPDVYGEYLVYMAKSDTMMILSFSPELNTFGIWDDEITHWKPRPDRPKIGKE